jgi:hypothetical protein
MSVGLFGLVPGLALSDGQCDPTGPSAAAQLRDVNGWHALLASDCNHAPPP